LLFRLELESLEKDLEAAKLQTEEARKQASPDDHSPLSTDPIGAELVTDGRPDAIG
jgi:serine/threonine protein kinase HipA of HipAB toxin-antitoxin module